MTSAGLHGVKAHPGTIDKENRHQIPGPTGRSGLRSGGSARTDRQFLSLQATLSG